MSFSSFPGVLNTHSLMPMFCGHSLFLFLSSHLFFCDWNRTEQQFFKHDFPARHSATTKRNTYRSCLVCDTCIRELIVIDCPLQVRASKLTYTMISTQINIKHFIWCFHQANDCWLIWCFYPDEISKNLSCCCRFYRRSFFISILSNPHSHPFFFICSKKKLATISRRQFSRMEWRTTVRPTHRTRICSRLWHGKFGNVSGNEKRIKKIVKKAEMERNSFAYFRYYFHGSPYEFYPIH